MRNNFDITIYPAENGFSIALDTYDKGDRTLRYNAATIDEATGWIGAKLRSFVEAVAVPEVEP